MAGRPPHQRSDETARQIRTMAQFGLPYEQMADIVGISVPTMRKHYRDELNKGAALANLKVGERLYKKAVEEGDTTALIFWAKCRMRWRTDAPEEVQEQAVPAVRVKVEDASRKKPAKQAEAPDA